MNYLLTYFTALVLICSQHLLWGDAAVAQILKEIPEADKKHIETLFHHLFKTNPFAYCLFGEKPLAFCFANGKKLSLDQSGYEFTENFLSADVLPIWLGIEALEKHKDKIYSKKYALLFLPREKPVTFFFVNKVAMAKTIAENIELAESCLGKGITVDQFIIELEEGKITVDKLFSNHEWLGIMLGFGKENSRDFQKEWDHKYGNLMPPYQDKLYPSFETKEKVFFNRIDQPPLAVNPIRFGANKGSEESNKLIEYYDLLEFKLAQIYLQDDWFETTLERFISSTP